MQTFKKIIFAVFIVSPFASVLAGPKSNLNNNFQAEWSLVSLQAGQIFDQAWSALQSEVAHKKLLPKHNPFILMNKAFDLEAHPNKKTKKIFNCERITSSRSEDATSKIEKTSTYFFSCQKNRMSFARVKFVDNSKVDFEFDPQSLEDVLGLQTSILGKKFSCQLWQEKKILISLSCQQLQIDFNGGHRAVFENFEYKRDDLKQIKATLVVYDQIQPIKKIQLDVPKEGSIKVVETYLSPPPGYVLPGTQKKLKAHAENEKKSGQDVQNSQQEQSGQSGVGQVMDPSSKGSVALPDQILKNLDEQEKSKGQSYPEPEYIESEPLPVNTLPTNSR